MPINPRFNLYIEDFPPISLESQRYVFVWMFEVVGPICINTR